MGKTDSAPGTRITESDDFQNRKRTLLFGLFGENIIIIAADVQSDLLVFFYTGKSDLFQGYGKKEYSCLFAFIVNAYKNIFSVDLCIAFRHIGDTAGSYGDLIIVL